MLCFFNLPRSVRAEIYRFSLVMKRSFVRPFISLGYLLNPNREAVYGTPNLSLLWSSKRIYEEAMPIYLSENIFSLVQVDSLVAARVEHPRVFRNLKEIRNLELVFDSRDYVYMAQFFSRELPELAAVIQHTHTSSRHKRKVIEDLCEIHDNLDIPGIYQSGSGSEMEQLSAEAEQKVHKQHIDNMKEYLWGRTMSSVRQTFKLSNLYIDLRQCTCIRGCCRLATEVLDWGWFRVWIQGMPSEIHVRGTSRREKEIIAQLFDSQRFHADLCGEEVFDQDRIEEPAGWKVYCSVFQKVHQTLAKQ